jgi:hypothetical protein
MGNLMSGSIYTYPAVATLNSIAVNNAIVPTPHHQLAVTVFKVIFDIRVVTAFIADHFRAHRCKRIKLFYPYIVPDCMVPSKTGSDLSAHIHAIDYFQLLYFILNILFAISVYTDKLLW